VFTKKGDYWGFLHSLGRKRPIVNKVFEVTSVTLSNAYSLKSNLEQRSAKRLFQIFFGFENQRASQHFL
jgi:hypothetical protein